MHDPERRARWFKKETIYKRLRADVIDYRKPFGPGRHLKIATLRKDYATNTGQIKLVLAELAAQGLIEHRPNCGYFMWEPSWQSIATDYRFENDLAKEALSFAQRAGRPLTAANDLTVRPPSAPDPRAAETSPQALTELTADVYARIIGLYGIPKASEDAIWLKDRLQFFRAFQFKIDPGAKPHLIELVRLFEAHEYGSLIGAVGDFYQRQVDGLDRVLVAAFGENYPGRDMDVGSSQGADSNGRITPFPKGGARRGV